MRHLRIACALIGALVACDGEDEPPATEEGRPDASDGDAASEETNDDDASDAATLDASDVDAARGEPDAGNEGTARERVLAFLDIYTGTVSSLWLDAAPAQEPEVLVSGLSALPDGIAIDEERGHIYWTNMGVPGSDDGSIQRVDLEGGDVVDIVAPGGTFTPKQLHLDQASGKLYWSDREGMRVMRANLDGSEVETLVVTGTGAEDRADASNWCVGIAIDPERGHLYWTQKGPDNGGTGSIKRASLELPEGESAEDRTDIEVLFEALPEPIDLALDLEQRHIYWTDRGDNTISRAPMDDPTLDDREILVTGLGEAIGVVLDRRASKLYFTALDGRLGVADLDGGNNATLYEAPGGLTGLALGEIAVER